MCFIYKTFSGLFASPLWRDSSLSLQESQSNDTLDSVERSLELKIKIIAIVCALSFMVAALLTAADITMYHIPGYYRHQFEEKDALGDLNRNIDMDNVMSAFSEMMEYLRGNRSNLNIEVTADGARQEFYTAREKAHLKDVRAIFLKAYLVRLIAALIFFISLICIFIYYKYRASYRSSICKTFINTCIITNAAFLLVVGIAAVNFDKAFMIFHKVLFANNYWRLNPNESDLINLLPQSFFEHTALVICGIYFVMAMASVVVALKLRHRS